MSKKMYRPSESPTHTWSDPRTQPRPFFSPGVWSAGRARPQPQQTRDCSSCWGPFRPVAGSRCCPSWQRGVAVSTPGSRPSAWWTPRRPPPTGRQEWRVAWRRAWQLAPLGDILLIGICFHFLCGLENVLIGTYTGCLR